MTSTALVIDLSTLGPTQGFIIQGDTALVSDPKVR